MSIYSSQHDIDRAKENIKNYESAKTFGNILNVAMAASGAGATYGGFSGNKKLLYPSLAGAFVSSFLKGRAANQEQLALNKMKNIYDIRRAERFANVGNSDIIPFDRGFKKQAVLGGAIEALTGVGKAIFGTPTLTELGGPSLPLMIDVAGLPYIAKLTGESTRDHIHVAAKDILGKVLTPTEKFKRGLSTLARSEQLAAEKMNTNVFGEIGEAAGSTILGSGEAGRFYGDRLGGAIKSTRRYLGGLLGPYGSGGQYGEAAGKTLKEVGKWSPKYRDLALDAIKGSDGVSILIDTIHNDTSKLQEAGKILNESIDEIPFARKFLNMTGRTGEGLAKKIIEKPETAVNMAKDFKTTIQKTVRGGNALAASVGLMGAGYMLGQMRKKHPLSENELPSKILE